MALVSIEADPRCDEIYPYQFPAVLRATFRDGTVRTTEALSNRGGTERPLTPDQLATKFTENMPRTLPDDRAVRLLQTIRALPTASGVEAVLAGTLP